MATSIKALRQIEVSRRALGVSRQKLCVRAGVAPSVYSKAINGKRANVRDGTIEKLVAALERLSREQRDLALRLKDIAEQHERNAA